MSTFGLLWLGQFVTILGSGLTAFSLGVWTYEKTGSVTEFGLVTLCAVAPLVLLAPLAGVLVDRWDRRRVMIASDTLAALSTLSLVLLHGNGQLQLWHVYLGVCVTSVASAFQESAFSAATTLLVRSLSGTERSTTIVLWQSVLMTVFTGLALPFVWVTPTGKEMLILLVIGLVGGVAQVLLTEAYASAQVSALGAFSYTGILWAVLLGWLAFGDRPGLATLAGAALIVAASLTIMHRELRRGKKP